MLHSESYTSSSLNFGGTRIEIMERGFLYRLVEDEGLLSALIVSFAVAMAMVGEGRSEERVLLERVTYRTRGFVIATRHALL
jgi:hypothetical protein